MNRKDLTIVLCGEAGQGVQTVEHALTRVLKLSGYHIFATKEYMSRIRGGSNSTEIRVSSRRVTAFRDGIDVLVFLSPGAVAHLKDRISPETILVGENENLSDEERGLGGRFIEVPFGSIAREIGRRIYSNSVAVGVVSGMLRVDPDVLEGYLRARFERKGREVVEGNLNAARRGNEIGRALSEENGIRFEIDGADSVKNEVLVNGTEAVALGAVAGGCTVLSFYPMSPSTGVAVFLSGHAEEFGIVTEQMEDEIAAVNMALGAWYAGGRGMVTTSGGGFALMVEGLSLSGMLETPLVIHLAQRPGPATGLPTRTEQGDLLFSLFAGHGEFARVVYAPGTLEDAFRLTRKAFTVSDRYQVPVLVLTDQSFVDSYANIPDLPIEDTRVETHIVRTDGDYRRYQMAEDGVSPRGIPGFGEGLVSVDSDEHDEAGHITEDLDLRVRMVDKRLKKLDLLKRVAHPPEHIGPENPSTLLVGWGSTRNAIVEAMGGLGRDDVALLHFSQVHPLPEGFSKPLKTAERTVLIEGNATGQFGRLVRMQTGFSFDHRVLKYNGLPFSVEELTAKLRKIVEG